MSESQPPSPTPPPDPAIAHRDKRDNRQIWPTGGIIAGRLHEVFAADTQDAANAAAGALVMALSVLPSNAPLLWLRLASAEKSVGLYAPGLAAIGIDPARVVIGQLPDALAVLRAGVDALRCTGIGVVIMELPGRIKMLDLTATRRMTLAAESSGATPILLRIGAAPVPSAAYTRWAMASAPSRGLPANAPGHPAFHCTLLRRRDGGVGGDWSMEWHRDTASFRSTTGPFPNDDTCRDDASHNSPRHGTTPFPRAAFSMAGGGSLAEGEAWRRTGAP